MSLFFFVTVDEKLVDLDKELEDYLGVYLPDSLADIYVLDWFFISFLCY